MPRCCDGAGRPLRLARREVGLQPAPKAVPADLSVHTVAVLLDCAGNDPTAIAKAAEQLERRVLGSPLEVLSEGTRPNARQRAEAASRLGLWLVARLPASTSRPAAGNGPLTI